MSSSLLTSTSHLHPKPFLKWAGGKTQLLPSISRYLPNGLQDGSITKYVEPFLGGGAVFFYIATNYPHVQEYYLYDINPELIIAYQTIKMSVDSLIGELLKLEDRYRVLSLQEKINLFYQIRSDFNQGKKSVNYHDFSQKWVQRTAQMIFLNRTCYNGLFRVNSQGYFNVPIGRYKNPTICNQQNLLAVSQVLQKTTIILAGDFELIKDVADNPSTFVYFDPPYRPISQTANFTAYSESVFDDEQQMRLLRLFRYLDEQGAKLMLSNSDPKNQDENDDFFDNIYANYYIQRIPAIRSINSNSLKRGKINEILIMNYHESVV